MVCLFFLVDNKFLIHNCENEKADKFGNFLNYPESHMDIWNKYYSEIYDVDFDYYPRGRVVYNTKEAIYYIYHDKCIKDLTEITKYYKNYNYKILKDYHYQCHICNKNYIS